MENKKAHPESFCPSSSPISKEESLKNEFETVVGLEVHAQLKTASKMFCGCKNSFGDPPNSNICPVCMGHPGTLPVVNSAAIEMAIKAALALNLKLNKTSIFARKNYFYPDLPKGYQISQHKHPISETGHLEFVTKDGGVKRVSIIRIHLEEDAGKSLHDTAHQDQSHVDYNRCGAPLIEIVSAPDMRSCEEATSYLKNLRAVLMYLGVCEGNMMKGNFRCDANISVRLKGSQTLGTRTELKNLNSFRAVERAIDYEAQRQIEIIKTGGKVFQETLLWNEKLQRTESMRKKEEAHDYRYFPEPDLLPLIISDGHIDKIAKNLPELPIAKLKRFTDEYGLSKYDAGVLTSEKDYADYFEKAVEAYPKAPKKIANWIMSELLRELKDEDADIWASRIKPKMLSELVLLIEEGQISGKMAKEVFEEMLKSGETAKAIVECRGLKQISDFGAIEEAVDQIIAAHPEQTTQYKSGKTGLLGFFVGQVIKKMKGQANPQIVSDILKKKLGG